MKGTPGSWGSWAEVPLSYIALYTSYPSHFLSTVNSSFSYVSSILTPIHRLGPWLAHPAETLSGSTSAQLGYTLKLPTRPGTSLVKSLTYH